jgi:zinc transport system substrate-binding protein
LRIILSIVVLAAATAAVLAAFAFDGNDANEGERRVAAAFYPLAFAAEEVGGGRIEVQNLTPPGVEPHDLEISPEDVRALRSADLVLLLGRGFQPQLERAAGHGKHVVRLLDTPGLGRFPNGDPHVWLDPLRYSRIVGRIAKLLGRPRAAAAFTRRLRALDEEFREGLADCRRREIVTSHEAFAYLADRYRLRQIAITGLSPEAEPTPRALERVVRLVRRTGATTIFFETLVSPRIAETVARETGATTAKLDPVEGLASDDTQADYFTIMRDDLTALRKGLGCR